MIFAMSENTKEQISLLTLENEKLKQKLLGKKTEAMELSKKLLNLQWSIKRSDFVAFYEERERERDRAVLRELSDRIVQAEEKWSGLDKRLAESKDALAKLNQEKELNSLEVQRLREINSKNEAKLFEINRTVCMLKNRNAAIKLKLTKQIQEFEEQIQILSSQMAEQ